MHAVREWTIRKSSAILGFDARYPLRGGFWLLSSQAFSALASLGIMSAFAYASSQELFGAYQYIASTAALVSVLALPGLNQPLARAVAQGKEATFHSIVALRAKGSFLIGLVLLGIAGYYFLQEDKVLAAAFAVSALLVPPMRIAESILPLWQGRQKFKEYATVETIGNVLPALLFVPLLFVLNNIALLIGAYFGLYFLVRAALFLHSRATVSESETDEGANRFGLHLSALQVLQVAAAQLDRIVLWHVAGPAAVATYTFASLPAQRLGDFFPIKILALPKMSASTIAKKRVMRAFLLLVLMVAVLIGVMALVAPFAYPLLFPGYEDSLTYFYALLFLLFGIPLNLIRTSLIAQTKTRAIYLTGGTPLLLRIGLYLILTPSLGIWGIIIASLVALLVNGVLLIALFLRS